MIANNKPFHLSVVATSRNDNHGGSLTARMQHFVDGFVQQCIRHQLSAELILVEWNPPKDKPPLAHALQFPAEKGGCVIRIITVPAECHSRLQHSDSLALFQMIAKNVGIRRAQGRYVLATNIDILFSDEIMQYIAHQLKPYILYRADRFDIPPEIPEKISFDDVLIYCRETAFRINTKFGTLLKVNGKWRQPFLDIFIHKIKQKYSSSIEKIAVLFHSLFRIRISIRKRYSFKNALKKCMMLLKKCSFRINFNISDNYIQRISRYIADRRKLHTNACGDFTLLSYQDWCDLRGYPEWEIFSWHIDSVLLYQANRNGIEEVNLSRKKSIYHIEHGSGYTPEQETKLFKRLVDNNIPFLSINDFWSLVNEMDVKRKQGHKTIYNSDTWGFSDIAFSEQMF
jgi:hypothetical protein